VSPPAKRALWPLGAFVLVAVAADLLASDRPLIARIGGRTHFLPCLTRSLTDDNQTLRARLQPGDWLVAPPIPYGPTAQSPGGRTDVLQPPSSTHWLGTDDRGRDVAARLVHATRSALAVGMASTLLAAAAALLVGLFAATSRRADFAVSRLVEIGLAFPTLFLLLCIQGLRGSTSLVEVTLAIAVTQWPHLLRLCRAEALRAAASPSVLAARALGATRTHLVVRHLAAAAWSPLAVAAAFALAQAVLLESGLALLGLGLPAPTPTWGELLAQAQASSLRAWLLWPATLAIAGVVLAANHAASRLEKN
jgi:peptide/nickel transport system permease protein